MRRRLSFARVAPLREHRVREPHSAQIHRLREERRQARESRDNETFLVFGLLIAIAAGLIVLRAALWLPPQGM